MKKWNRLAAYVLLSALLATAAACHRTGAAAIHHHERHAKTSAQRDQVVHLARRLVGKPYRAACNDPKRGFDCSGLVQYAFRGVGVKLPRTSAAQALEGRAVDRAKVLPGDLAVFRLTPRGRVFHVGLVSKVQARCIYIIHASSSRGVIEECIEASPYWRTKDVRFRNVLDLP